MYLMYEFSDGYKVIAYSYSAKDLAAEEELHGPMRRLSMPEGKDVAEFFRKEVQKGAHCETDTEEPAAVVDVEEPEEPEKPEGELSGAIIDKFGVYRALKNYYAKREACLGKHIAALMHLKDLRVYSGKNYEAYFTVRGLMTRQLDNGFLQEVLRDV